MSPFFEKKENKLNQNRRFFPKTNCPTLIFSIIPGYVLVHQRDGLAKGGSQEVTNFLVLDLRSPHIKREREKEGIAKANPFYSENKKYKGGVMLQQMAMECCLELKISLWHHWGPPWVSLSIKALQVVRPISQIPRECQQREDVKNQ